MKLDVALLCDAATVREGLLHVLGGGVTKLSRPDYPAPLGVQLAVRVTGEWSEASGTHKLEVALVDADSEQVALFGADLTFQQDPEPDRELPFSGAFVVPVQAVPLPAPDVYRFIVRLDGAEAAVVPFRAELPPLAGTTRASASSPGIPWA